MTNIFFNKVNARDIKILVFSRSSDFTRNYIKGGILNDYYMVSKQDCSAALLESRDKLISEVLRWTPTHGHTSVIRPARAYIQQLSTNFGCVV